MKVTDSASDRLRLRLSLTINPAALGITTSSLPAGTVGHGLFAGARRFGRIAALFVVDGQRIAAGGIESLRGRHHIGHARRRGNE